MTVTYEAIATQTLGSATATVTFSSIPSTFTDLVLVFNGANTATGPNDSSYRINGDTGNNYSRTFIYGDGSNAVSSRGSNENQLYLAGFIGSTNSTVITNFNNYANSTTYKTVIGRCSIPNANTFAGVGLWRNTGAITSISSIATAGSYATGSTFSLYGIKAE
jgi:hypothetical protein